MNKRRYAPTDFYRLLKLQSKALESIKDEINRVEILEGWIKNG